MPDFAVQWGQINGLLAAQTDLKAALDAKVTDAPADSTSYVRRNNAWVPESAGPIPTDAPSDGATYGRRNAAWDKALSLAFGGAVSGPVTFGGATEFNATATFNNALLAGGPVTLLGVGTQLLGTPVAATGSVRWMQSKKGATGGFSNELIGAQSGDERWTMRLGDGTDELGANSGSNFALDRHDDAGFPLGTPLTIDRATGDISTPSAVNVGGVATFTAPVGSSGSAVIAPASGNAALRISKALAGSNSAIFGATGAALRWSFALGDNSAEAGSNAGSDLNVIRYDDAGAVLAQAMRIGRHTGYMTFGPGATRTAAADAITAGIELSKIQTAANCQIVGLNNGSIRWVMRMGEGTAESGSNAGSNFNLTRYTDAGAHNGDVIQINRSNGAMVTPLQPSFLAIGCNAATTGTVLSWSSVTFNVGANFNSGTGRFTAPVAGTYFFSAQATGNSGAAGEVRLAFRKNSVSLLGSRTIVNKSAGQFITAKTSIVFQLAAGDFVETFNESSPEALFSADTSFSNFCGYLLG